MMKLSAKRVVLALVLPLVAPAALAQGRPAAGSGSPMPANAPIDVSHSQVTVAYGTPSNPQFSPIRDRLMRRRVLEQLQIFLSPLRLPHKLSVRIDQCGALRQPYRPGGNVVICYEYIARIEQVAARQRTVNSPPPDSIIVGAFVQATLHEVAEAVFDMFELPVWGRQEDAADRLAGFIMVQFGKDVARKVLLGAAWFFEATNRTWTGNDFASIDSPEAQRFYNYLCIAYGADSATFHFLAEQGLLPERRAQHCAQEYHKLRFAFDKTILPHVDRVLLRRVQFGDWLMLDDPQ